MLVGDTVEAVESGGDPRGQVCVTLGLLLCAALVGIYSRCLVYS